MILHYIFYRYFVWKNLGKCSGECSSKKFQTLNVKKFFFIKSYDQWSASKKYLLVLFGTAGLGITFGRQFQWPLLNVHCEDPATSKKLSKDVYDSEKLEKEDGEDSLCEDSYEIEAAKDLKFPWNEFLKLLLPDVWYLLGAVAVRSEFLLIFMTRRNFVYLCAHFNMPYILYFVDMTSGYFISICILYCVHLVKVCNVITRGQSECWCFKAIFELFKINACMTNISVVRFGV